MNNYDLAKQVGLRVGQRSAEEELDVAYKRRVVSLAVSRKKKVAVDAIANVVKGSFLKFTMTTLRLILRLTEYFLENYYDPNLLP